MGEGDGRGKETASGTTARPGMNLTGEPNGQWWQKKQSKAGVCRHGQWPGGVHVWIPL